MGKRVLIVDDASVIRKVVAMTLSPAGFEIIEAEDGSEALGKLDGTEINLCICDVNMPVLDGMSFVEKVKNDGAYAAYKFMPIIMLTTESGADMKEVGKRAGVKAWLVKPFHPEELMDAVKKIAGSVTEAA